MILQAVEHAAKINGDDLIPVHETVVRDGRLVAADAGIVDGQVEPTKTLEGKFDRTANGFKSATS